MTSDVVSPDSDHGMVPDRGRLLDVAAMLHDLALVRQRDGRTDEADAAWAEARCILRNLREQSH